MPTILLDPPMISLVARFAPDSLRIDCEGRTLPADDLAIVCLVSPGARVRFSIAFVTDAPAGSLASHHIDSAGQLVQWSGANPRTHEFGLTGDFVDVTVACSASGVQRTTLIPIKIRPKTDKPF